MGWVWTIEEKCLLPNLKATSMLDFGTWIRQKVVREATECDTDGDEETSTDTIRLR